MELTQRKSYFSQKFIGDKKFYKRVLAIAVPIMLQSGITNFVSLLDNIMVGRIGTEQMSGVAIVNQLLFVFYLCVFGGLSGVGIFTAQYYGAKDYEGIKHTFRYKLWLVFILFIAAALIFVFYGKNLISLYLNDSNSSGDLAKTLSYGSEYLKIILFGLPAFSVVQVYANTLRECSETVVPMRAGFAAVGTNLVLDYILIFGKFGLPALGVKGAAIATVIARFVEMSVVVIWTHTHKDRCPYIKGIYRKITVPKGLIKKYFITGMPLLINEGLWSGGMAILSQCYSLRGLDVVAGQNISSTVSNVFNVIFFAMGDTIAIIIGQHLGSGNFKKAKEEDNKIIAFAIFIATMVGILILISSPFFPKIYNTTDEARRIATRFLITQAIFTPQIALLHTTYFTVRSGGRTIITFLFDSVFMLVVSVPIAFILSRYTSISAPMIYAFVNIGDWIKCIIGIILVKKGVWMKNIVSNNGS